MKTPIRTRKIVTPVEWDRTPPARAIDLVPDRIQESRSNVRVESFGLDVLDVRKRPSQNILNEIFGIDETSRPGWKPSSSPPVEVGPNANEEGGQGLRVSVLGRRKKLGGRELSSHAWDSNRLDTVCDHLALET